MASTVSMVTDMAINSTTEAPAVTAADWLLIRSVYFYLMGIVVPLGLFCNALALAVFIRSPTLRRTVTGHFLMALAIADLIFLLGDFLRWLNPSMKDFNIGLDFMHTSSGACQFTHFLRYFGRFASSWITVAIAVQRFLTVVRALEVARISTVPRVRVVLLTIVVTALVLNLFPFWTMGSREWGGRVICAYLETGDYHTWNTVVMRVGSLLIPAAAIFVLTGIIVGDLVKVRKIRRHNLRAVQNAEVERQLSGMLVAVALAFLCLRLPYVTAYYLNTFKSQMFRHDSVLFYRIYCIAKITDVIATFNHAANFFLYCLVGSTFRRHFKQVCQQKNTRMSRGGHRDITMTSSLKTTVALREQNSTRLLPNRLSRNQDQAILAKNDQEERFA
ncbi:hypothetical protein CAPTEDRAFT_204751 [Capitella teleta]|uniref:G-protein coupled receptors family 1 profile domain-containing protein n=1 Tax=Capitella teleta TaxID=283909 RepID=R7V113_CAPTE|nr:hypothetical protein CAPTEDRAFT_204751 [Capitella teleta]|eukprot:ELU12204.1 hypothetical protein CAPTEDRAFT_204751 [Capitella teleta]